MPLLQIFQLAASPVRPECTGWLAEISRYDNVGIMWDDGDCCWWPSIVWWVWNVWKCGCSYPMYLENSEYHSFCRHQIRNFSISAGGWLPTPPGPHYHKKPSVHQPSSEAFHQTAPERKESQQRKRQQLLNHHHKDNNNPKKRSINSIWKEADRNLRLQMLGMRSHSCIYHSILELSPCLLSTTFGNLTALHL